MFRLAPGRVSCDVSGLRVGAIDLLTYRAGAGGLLGDASAIYPNFALAQIVALSLQMPDLPDGDAADGGRLLVDLAACGLLKADADFDAKHPRTGAPPNPGGFSTTSGADAGSQDLGR